MCTPYNAIQTDLYFCKNLHSFAINTFFLCSPSHPLHLPCYLDNPPPLRCGQAQIPGVLVLLNSRLKSLAGLAHCLQNVWTQLKIATPSQQETLSQLLCLPHHCARM